ncbi:hypothetical protein PHISCL_08974 [Aspergillus sclerotialis]|uniref:Protein TMA23 n=1 Tax=Aspergillus sclerotialis TaxID=2070753 RepID=A0A3A2Z7T4_9EURO|nr:hypothetical protein PHISCL_08974 [Aspergillus sclerotialis]
MDAQAYLLRLGWSGPGNPLNPNKRPGPHGGLGLTKPILAARKHNTHGLGRTTTADPKNMWWLRGFEDVLKGVGDDGAGEERRGDGVARTGLTGELYRFFVRGQGLKGTIGESEAADKKEVKKRLRKEEKRRRRKLECAATDPDVATSTKESKEDRRRRKQEKREKRERKEMKRAKKAKLEKREPGEEDYPTPAATEPEQDGSQDGSVDIKASKRREKKQKEGKKDKKEKKSKDKNLKKESISENSAKSKSKKEKKDKRS